MMQGGFFGRVGTGFGVGVRGKGEKGVNKGLEGV